jgi:type II secretory pathway pseudopilin PulG
MRKSVTLMEVLVSAVILASVTAGLFATFVAVRRYINRANRRIIATNLARSVLEDLYKNVRADTWNSSVNALYAPSTGAWQSSDDLSSVFGSPSLTIDNNLYGGTDSYYQVRQIAGRSYREVQVFVEYPQNQ